jgi:hypothetical protein
MKKTARRARRPRPGLALLAGILALAGCASDKPLAWRVEPTARTTNVGAANSAQGYLALARQYDGEGRHAQALEFYRKAALEAPYDPDVLDQVGVAEAAQGDYAHAVETLRRAAVLAPGRAPIVNNLGYALLLDGHASDACRVFRLALAIDPDYALAKLNLAQSQAAADAQASVAAKDSVATPSAKPDEVAPPPAVQSASTSTSPGVQVSYTPNVPALQMATATPLEHGTAPVGESSASAAAPARLPSTTVGETAPAEAVHAERSAIAAGRKPEPVTGVRVEITNGNGVKGMAAWLRGWLAERGLEGHTRLSNLLPYATSTTVVTYRAGYAAQAREIAHRMPRSVELVQDSTPTRGASSADVVVVLGHDMRDSVACSAQGCGRSPSSAVLAAADVAP